MLGYGCKGDAQTWLSAIHGRLHLQRQHNRQCVMGRRNKRWLALFRMKPLPDGPQEGARPFLGSQAVWRTSSGTHSA